MQNQTIGFIGLGVMGGGMAKNTVRKHGGQVRFFDLNAQAMADVGTAGGTPASSVAEAVRDADVIFLSLPGGKQVKQVCLGEDGIAASAKRGAVVVDLSTTTVADARAVAAGLAEKGVEFVDAPVARGRQAAIDGTLSIMVGATETLFAKVEPLLRYMATDVSLCGEVGCGQAVKLINNTLLMENITALAEMMIVGERAGVAPGVLLDVLSKGSADSFALRNHGMKAMLPRQFPAKAFPVPYAIKDLSYTMELAKDCGVHAKLPGLAMKYLERALEKGYSDEYFPVIIEVVETD